MIFSNTLLDMKTKELIIQEIEEMPEALMTECLELIRNFKSTQTTNIRPKIWEAYLESLAEYEEVYRKLAEN
jgi:hypothetical protein